MPLPQSLAQLSSVRCASLQGLAAGDRRRKDVELSLRDPGSGFGCSAVLWCYSPGCPETCDQTNLKLTETDSL